MINTHKEVTLSIVLFILSITLTYSVPTLPEGIHSLTVGPFQSDTTNKSQQVMSYYDFNQDEYCDVLTIVTSFSSDNKKIQSQYLTLYLWSEKEKNYVKSADANLGVLNVKTILSTQLYHRTTHETDLVIVYDYIGTDYSSSQSSTTPYSINFMKIVYNPSTDLCSITSSISPISAVSLIDPIHPTIIILSGRISIIYRKNNQAFVLYFLLQSTGEVTYQIQSLVGSNNYLTATTQQIGNLPYELTYFGDYNGDGIADLIVSQKYSTSTNTYTKINFFKYNKTQTKFTLQKTFDLRTIQDELSTTVKFFTLHDVNYDGKIDLILLFRSGVIQIHYNNQSSSQTELITTNGFATFPFDLYQITESANVKIQRLKLTNYLPSQSSTLLFGDFNLDGYDDLIVDYQYDISTGVFDKSGNEITKKAQKSLLLINSPCTSVTDCGDSTFNTKFLKTLDLFAIRKFTILNTLPTAYKTSESQKMFFIDLYKDGKLDLISHRLSNTSSYIDANNQQQKSGQIDFYYNNEHYDAFFMKVRVMRGSDYTDIHNNLVVPGGNVNLFVTGLSGEMLPKVGNQYTQAGAMIHLPYVFFGLGRTNNYVNQLTITIPYVVYLFINKKVSQNLTYTYMWTPIIPNSQVLTLANPQGSWQLSAFIQPTQKMAMVSLLVILALGVIGFFICRLTLQQKNQDKENLESFYTILR